MNASAAPATAEQAAQALRAAARADSVHGRALVHCYVGSLGSDWELGSALALLEGAQAIAWQRNLVKRDLTVVDADGRVYFFNTGHYEEERAPAPR